MICKELLQEAERGVGIRTEHNKSVCTLFHHEALDVPYIDGHRLILPEVVQLCNFLAGRGLEFEFFHILLSGQNDERIRGVIERNHRHPGGDMSN